MLNIEIELIIKYIEKNKYNLTYEEILGIAGLLSTYEKVAKVTHNSDGKLDQEGIDKLKRYENYIYTIKGKIISEKNRVELELKRIEIILNQNSKISNGVKKELKKEIKNLSELKEEQKYIPYIKEKISIIQAMLGIDNTFLYDAYHAFDKKYKIILEDILQKNMKKNNNYYNYNFDEKDNGITEYPPINDGEINNDSHIYKLEGNKIGNDKKI